MSELTQGSLADVIPRRTVLGGIAGFLATATVFHAVPSEEGSLVNIDGQPDKSTNEVSVPVLTAPEGVDLWDRADPESVKLLTHCEELIRSISKDQHAGTVLPYGWDLKSIKISVRV